MIRTALFRTALPARASFVAARSYASQDPNAKSTARKVMEGADAALSEPHATAGQKVDKAAKLAGAAADSSPENPSVISSAGAVGKQFNPDGSIGQIGEKIGGPFSKDGAIGSQFDASKDGIAGQVEKAVDGPAQKKH